MSEFRRELLRSLQGHVSFSEELIMILEAHFELLRRWNGRVNLTSVIEPKEAARKHYAESLILAAMLPRSSGTWVDFGSGAGFPGFPIAAARRDLQLVLLEADQRKASFLRECRDIFAGYQVQALRGDQFTLGVEGLVSRAVVIEDILRFVKRKASVSHVGLLLAADIAKLGRLQNWELCAQTTMSWDSHSVAGLWKRST